MEQLEQSWIGPTAWKEITKNGVTVLNLFINCFGLAIIIIDVGYS